MKKLFFTILLTICLTPTFGCSQNNKEPILQNTTYHSSELLNNFTQISRDDFNIALNSSFDFKYTYAHMNTVSEYPDSQSAPFEWEYSYAICSNMYTSYNIKYNIIGHSGPPVMGGGLYIMPDYLLQYVEGTFTFTKEPYSISIDNINTGYIKSVKVTYDDYFEPVSFYGKWVNDYYSSDTTCTFKYFNDEDLPGDPGFLSKSAGLDHLAKRNYFLNKTEVNPNVSIEFKGTLYHVDYHFPTCATCAATSEMKARYDFDIKIACSNLYPYPNTYHYPSWVYPLYDYSIISLEGNIPESYLIMMNYIVHESAGDQVGQPDSYKTIRYELDDLGRIIWTSIPNHQLSDLYANIYDDYKTREDRYVVTINQNGLIGSYLWENGFYVRDTDPSFIGTFEAIFEYN